MIITRVPLRISFFGGGTDIPKFFEIEDGAVFSTSIERYVHVCMNKKFTPGFRVSYSQTENEAKLENIKNELLRESLLEAGISDKDTNGSGIELVTMSDVPTRGSGLGASSAMSIATLLAAKRFKNREISNSELAEAACRVETQRMQKPIGYQDQYACALGGPNLIHFSPQGVRVEPCLYHPAFEYLMNHCRIFYIGNREELNADIILGRAPEPPSSTLKSMGELAVRAPRVLSGFKQYILGEFGEMLNENWRLKKLLTPMTTNSYIDYIYQESLSSGALGSKILGAGAGGFLLTVLPDDYTAEKIKSKTGLTCYTIQADYRGARILGGQGE